MIQALIAGLGNPGTTYDKTRHNIGFMAVDALAESRGVRRFRSRSEGLVSTIRLSGREVELVKPQSYMNRSGGVVSRLMSHHSLDPGDLIVVYDDIDLPFGRIRIRQGGGSGGHKGVQSIIDDLGSAEFIRIRLGISRPEGEGEVSDYVLERFAAEEELVLHDVIKRAIGSAAMILSEGLIAAMNIYNRVVDPGE